ncbi:hypothetical protein ABFS83_11G037700 [Erythranthe nasuta]
MANRQAFSPASPPTVLGHGKSVSNKTTVLGVLVIVIVILFVGGWFCFCFRKKLRAKFCRLFWKQKVGKLEAEKMNLRRFRMEELQKATDNFSQACMVGKGAFGNVYRGTFDTEGITLAIKKPHAESYISTEEFRNEVKLLSKVKHENLVGLVGFCEGNGKGPNAAKILVYEYVTNGSLLDYIIGRGGSILTWRERVNIAIGAAKGIAHLHEEISPSIIHRDIKPSNILIGDGFEAKVSDFGLVRSGPDGDKSHVTSQLKGTPGYMDPAYCSSFHLTPFTDVYSFGVILLQLVTARPAVESSRSSTHSHIIHWASPSIEKGRVEDIIDTNLLVQGCNMEIMLKIGQLALKCVVKEPKERPTMTQVWQELEQALKSADCLLLPVASDHRSMLIGTNNYDRPITSSRSIPRPSDHDYSHSIERFDVDVDGLSFHSASLRCLSISVDDDFSIPR